MYLVGSLLDIDNKVGLELEQFVGIWGFGRLQGKASKGVVRITVPTPLTTDQILQLGSQFYAKIGLAGSGERMYFASTQAVVLVAGSYSVDIPVECTVVGTQGNIPPDAITSLGLSISGGTVTNLSSFTGGVDVETDQELRQRFKDTMMRNIAGTTDWYRAICLQNDTVSRVEVFGPTTMYKTQIVAPAETLVLSLDANVKYVWCLTPNTRVLNGSLDWVPVGSLRVGDDIVGFDEEPQGGIGQKRCWQKATVTASSVSHAETFTLTTNDGAQVTSTGDHQWLVSRRRSVGQKGKKKGTVRSPGTQWVKTKDVLPGDMIRYIPPWDADESFDAGWMSGIVDGEASYNKYNLTIMQNDGPVYDRIVDILQRNKFSFKTQRTRGGLSPEARCNEILLQGGMEARLKFFGLFKSTRLMSKFMDSLYGTSIVGKWCSFAEIVSVEPAGNQEIVELSTSTKTLVAEGLLSHNTDMEAVFINLGQTDEVFYRPGTDYTLSSGTSPTFTRVAAGQIAEDAIIDLEFQYVTRSSRNDPVNGITNKVDIFMDGMNPYTVTEKTVMTSTALTASPSLWNYTGNFERVGSFGGVPTAGNKFVRLTSVPIISFPSTLTIGTSVYTEGTHYWLLRSITTAAGSHYEVSGLEWNTSGPAVGTEMELSYIYNRIPEVLAAIIRTSKQICTDVMVHQAKWRYIAPCLSVEYDRTYSVSLVNTAIQNQLTRYFSAMKFGQHFKVAALLMAVQQVLGVTNVGLTTAAENPDRYGIEVYDDAVDTDPLAVYTNDFRLDDNSLPVLLTAQLLRRAAS